MVESALLDTLSSGRVTNLDRNTLEQWTVVGLAQGNIGIIKLASYGVQELSMRTRVSVLEFNNVRVGKRVCILVEFDLGMLSSVNYCKHRQQGGCKD